MQLKERLRRILPSGCPLEDMKVTFETEDGKFFYVMAGTRVAEAISLVPDLTIEMLQQSLIGSDEEFTTNYSVCKESRLPIAKWIPLPDYEDAWAGSNQWMKLVINEDEYCRSLWTIIRTAKQQ